MSENINMDMLGHIVNLTLSLVSTHVGVKKIVEMIMKGEGTMEDKHKLGLQMYKDLLGDEGKDFTDVLDPTGFLIFLSGILVSNKIFSDKLKAALESEVE